MELKQQNFSEWGYNLILLIVPYGIETSIPCMCILSKSLLIVPYGIETNKNIVRAITRARF